MEEESEDSLDLLLDTLCNAFGGIILITLLIALMSQEAKDEPDVAESYESEWMLEQQEVLRIESELIIEEAILDSLLENLSEDEINKDSLSLEKKQKLEQEKKVVIANLKQLTDELDSMPVNSSNLAVDLHNKLKSLEKNILSQSMLKEEQRAKIQNLQEKLSDVQQDISASKNERTLALRLPKEKKSGKNYQWMVIKHGLVYPRDYPNISEIFTVVEESPTDKIFIPRPGKGFDITKDQSRMLNYLLTVNPKSTYLAFTVFDNDECFRTFNKVKQMVTSRGLGYTWEPLSQDLRLTTSGEGREAGNEL
jgi:hypothetical protein